MVQCMAEYLSFRLFKFRGQNTNTYEFELECNSGHMSTHKYKTFRLSGHQCSECKNWNADEKQKDPSVNHNLTKEENPTLAEVHPNEKQDLTTKLSGFSSDTKVLMFDGTIKELRDIKIGDRLWNV